MKNIKIIYLMTIAFLGACSLVRVLNTESEPDFKLSNYKSFNFYDLVGRDTIPANMEEKVGMLKQEIIKQMEQRGLSRSGQPDLLINIGSVVEEKIQTRPTNIQDAPQYIGQRRYTWKSE